MLATLAVVAGVVALGWFRPVDRPRVVVACSDAVPFGMQDRAFLTSPGGIPSAETLPEPAGRDAFRLTLDRAFDAPKTLVLVAEVDISADELGRPQLSFDAAGDTGRNRLGVAELVSATARPRPTVVVLRATGDNAKIGAAVAEAVGDNQHVIVVAETARPLGLTDLAGRSAFALELARAWHGADGRNPEGVRDRRVDVGELAEALRARLTDFSRHSPGVHYDVTAAGSLSGLVLGLAADPPPVEVPRPGVYPPELVAAWAERDRRIALGEDESAPEAFARWERDLIAAENLWVAGTPHAPSVALSLTDYERGRNAERNPAGDVFARPLSATDVPPGAVDRLHDAIEAADPKQPLGKETLELLAGNEVRAAVAALLMREPAERGAAWANLVRAVNVVDPAGDTLEARVVRLWAGGDSPPVAGLVRCRLIEMKCSQNQEFHGWAAGTLDELQAKLVRAEAAAREPGYGDPALQELEVEAGVHHDALRHLTRCRRAMNQLRRFGLPNPLGAEQQRALFEPRPLGLSELAARAGEWAGAAERLEGAAAARLRSASPEAIRAAVERGDRAELDNLVRLVLPNSAERAAIWGKRLALHAEACGRFLAGESPQAVADGGDFVVEPADEPAIGRGDLSAWAARLRDRANYLACDPADHRQAEFQAWHRREAAALGGLVPHVAASPTASVRVESGATLGPTSLSGAVAVAVRPLRATEGGAAMLSLGFSGGDALRMEPMLATTLPPLVETVLVRKVSAGPGVRESPPRGVLATVEYAGRTYYRRAAVDVRALVDRLTVEWEPAAGPVGPGWSLRSGAPNRATIRLGSAGDAARNVIVRLPGWRAESVPVAVPARGSQSVTFAAQPPGPANTQQVVDTRQPVQVVVVEAESKKVLQDDELTLEPVEVGRLVAVESALVRPMPNGGEVEVRVRLRADRGAAAVPVELALVDGQNKPVLAAAGSQLARLTRDLPAARLTASGLRPGEAVTAALTVDRSRRVVRLTGEVPRGGADVELVRGTAPGLVVGVDPVASNAVPFVVPVGVFDAPDGSVIAGTLGPLGGATERAAGPVPAVSRVAELRVTPEGLLELTPANRDPELAFDVARLTGEKRLTVTLRAAGGAVLAEESRPVTFDEQLPANVRFIGLPPVVARGEPVAVVVKADVPPSGLKSAEFYWGEPAGGMPPAGAVVVPGKPTAPGTFAATLPGLTLPSGRLTVVITSNVGLSASQTASVETADAADLARPKPGSIRGVVAEGAVPQAGLAVTVADAKDPEKPVQTVKTDAAGRFLVGKLPPGEYDVRAEKGATNRVAAARVTVAPGRESAVRLSLLLK